VKGSTHGRTSSLGPAARRPPRGSAAPLCLRNEDSAGGPQTHHRPGAGARRQLETAPAGRGTRRPGLAYHSRDLRAM